MKTGIQVISAERARHTSAEGWTAEHDQQHGRGELLDAGLSYLHAAINVGHPSSAKPPQAWPWGPQWWKPSDDPIRNLAKAGSLIAAEIDRLQIAALSQKLGGPVVKCAACRGAGFFVVEAGDHRAFEACETCEGGGFVVAATPEGGP